LPEVHDGLEGVLDVVAETIEQVRELSYRLRPAALEEFGLPVALKTLANDMAEEAGLEVQCQIDSDSFHLPAGIEVTLYRIAQEALTNVLRHAKARRIQVELTYSADEVWMRIVDDGQGFLPHLSPAELREHHLGLISMEERAAIAGGRLEIDSAPGKGTIVNVYIPVLEKVK
jgi:signal transduction histidine kinase